MIAAWSVGPINRTLRQQDLASHNRDERLLMLAGRMQSAKGPEGQQTYRQELEPQRT